MKIFVFCNLMVVLLSFGTCNGQNTRVAETDKKAIVGGGCESCELMYIGMPEDITSVSTSAGWFEKGQKLVITGTVFHLDGKTPAKDVIVYYWQTDNNGYYSEGPGLDKRAKRHGHIRGWVKTGADGQYTIKTIRPAPYPGDAIPAHIHLAIKEPDIDNEYYTDEINFDDDKLLVPHFRIYPQENRGGSGVVRVLLKDSLQIAEHDIVLGLNIPNYPKRSNRTVQSGLNIGVDQPSFIPYHAFGPDKGSRACPVCKYGRYHGIIYFVGNEPDSPEIKSWLKFLEQESDRRKKYLKVYFVYGNSNGYNKNERQIQLEKLGNELGLQNTALTFVPSFSDRETEANLNKINPDVENTFIIYKHRSIVDKYLNLKPTAANMEMLSGVLDKTKGAYFDLAEPKHD